MGYWRICIEEALSEVGIEATEEQIVFVTNWVEGAHENYGLATGQECIPNPFKEENHKLEKALEYERSLEHCRTCDGKGVTRGYGGTFMSTSECFKCHGKGKHP